MDRHPCRCGGASEGDSAGAGLEVERNRAKRHAALAARWAASHAAPCAIWSSAERKALEAAAPLAHAFTPPSVIEAALGENDRSATGYKPEPEFSAVARKFLANLEESILGWEGAADAQARIVAAVGRVAETSPEAGDIAIITHGAVATLLLCAPLGFSTGTSLAPGISGGGGTCALEGDRLLRGWRPVEAPDALDR